MNIFLRDYFYWRTLLYQKLVTLKLFEFHEHPHFRNEPVNAVILKFGLLTLFS